MEKNITVDGHDYLLKITAVNKQYSVTLCSVNNNINNPINGVFKDLFELRTLLRQWIIDNHFIATEDAEIEFFKEINEWDGVIEI